MKFKEGYNIISGRSVSILIGPVLRMDILLHYPNTEHRYYVSYGLGSFFSFVLSLA